MGGGIIMKSMVVPLTILGLFFLIGFGTLYFLWSSKNDETHFADQLLDYTDITVPDKNKIKATYQGRNYEITGLDVDDIYRILDLGDGFYRTRSIFKKDLGKDIIRLQFGDTADIYLSKDDTQPERDVTIMKYKDLEDNKTKYYTVEYLRMFDRILEIVHPVHKE